jgi:outer membrane protein insertion porin family
VRASVNYKFENVFTERRSSQLPNLPPFPFQDVGSDTTSSVTLGLTRDTRDYPLDATEGSYQSTSVEIAGLGGDNNFGKYRLEARNYLPLFGERISAGRQGGRAAWVLATRAQLSWSSGRLPFSQSYFIGGSETLRGYTEDRFFGNRAMLFNLELRRAFKNNIQVVGFFDAGRAWRQSEDLDLINDLATSVGIGARVATPLGPIRLDLGFGGEGMRTHFSFGQPF